MRARKFPDERRQHERFDHIGACAIETLDAKLAVDGLVSNIGEFGARIQVGPWLTNEGLEWLDTGVRVVFDTVIHPINGRDTIEKKLSCLASIAWIDRTSKNLIGLRFIAMMPYQRRRLLDLIADYKAGVR